MWITRPEPVANLQQILGIKPTHLELPDGDVKPYCNGNANHTHHEKGQTNGGKIPNGTYHIKKTNGHIHTESHLTKTGGNTKERHQKHTGYQIENWYWYYLFFVGALLGDDVFYYTFYPFWFYNINSWVIRRIILMWGIIMYVGQASKEVLKWPRPGSPPVVPLEPRYFQEYGMPSTHAMVGTLIPFGIFFLTVNRVEYSIPLAFLAACTWTTLVCFSRLYRGMHFVMDIIVGVLLTFLLMAIIFPVLESLDEFMLHNPYAPFILPIVITTACLLYPTQRGWSSTREDTIVILSAVGSIYTSLWLANHYGWYLDRYNDELPTVINWPSLFGVVKMFLRELIGLVSTLVTHLMVKPIMLKLLSIVYGIQITPETKKWLLVEYPYKYVTYTLVTLTSMLVSPMMFDLVGL